MQTKGTINTFAAGGIYASANNQTKGRALRQELRADTASIAGGSHTKGACSCGRIFRSAFDLGNGMLDVVGRLVRVVAKLGTSTHTHTHYTQKAPVPFSRLYDSLPVFLCSFGVYPAYHGVTFYFIAFFCHRHWSTSRSVPPLLQRILDG